LSVGSKKNAVFTSWDAQFLTAISSEVTAIVFTTKLVEELEIASEHLRQAYVETVMMLAATAEAHDSTTGRHILRVRALSESIALELGYRDEQAAEIGLASVLHDIGKIRVPDSVLGSTSSLSETEWAIMKQHTIWGAEFLDGRLGFELAAVVAGAHHERWDGAGYPKGLSGDDIPEAAQITSVADSFDAMTSDRPYRAGRSAEEAVAELAACSGTQFSPRVVQAIVRLHERGGLPLIEREQAREGLAA
jgi:HD-GYP domain-containing protein (c-di-GMP phosphodiesterase class II)